MMVQGNSKSVATYEGPKFSTCEFVKGYHQTNKLKTTKKNYIKEKELSKSHFLPGLMVSAYKYISRDAGRHYHQKCKSDTSEILSGR